MEKLYNSFDKRKWDWCKRKVELISSLGTFGSALSDDFIPQGLVWEHANIVLPTLLTMAHVVDAAGCACTVHGLPCAVSLKVLAF